YHHHNHQPFNIYPTTHHTNTTQFADQSNLVHTRYMAVRHHIPHVPYTHSTHHISASNHIKHNTRTTIHNSFN
ncbi:hypothetical protein LINPERPRIM_LOCUS27785, partial [Linum perenne]